MKTNSSPDSESEPAQPHEEAASTGETWRSSLYPENWYPGYKNADGHFVHDWSYAGYRQGEQDIPDTVPGCVFDVTHPHYGADPAGENDSTASIQRAISDAGHAGGGTVYLPAGTYKISLERSKDPSDAVLFIEHSGVVLRGAGVGETRLLNTTSAGMRFKDVIQVAPESGPHWAVTDRNQRNNAIYWETKRLLTQDVPEMSTVIHVDDVSGYQVGDDIFIGFELTDAWIAEHGLTGVWDSANMTTYGVADETGGMFSRTITAIDPANDTIAIDIPTRYWLKSRDKAMVWKHQLPFIREVGIEDISMGSAIEGGTTTSIGSGTYGYNIMNAHNITFQYVKDGWVRRVESYNAGNPHGLELLSNGIKLNMSRNVTVQDTTFRNAQHLGDGGNGYLYTLSGNDNLLERATAIGGRHNYTFGRFFSTGNVIFNSVGQDSAHGPSDFHMFLSAANLIDSMRFDGDYFEAMYRPWGDPIHGHTSSQTTFWNTYGESYFRDRPFIIDSRQYGYGYVVGTSGPASAIQTTPTVGWWEWHTDTAPEDIAEGEGLGETLAPQSLYLDQKARRLGN
ncbi:hypothetical protein FE782_09000 [Paenibacillus antri]|uniref:Rhamnogalacturonase A/B/Epimerase-like pectate lyase domain-containing protein n=2 Tax=Paenibacillus antri TaxID=2582848 RepID=A0A5R9GJ12_9BACL|nr:hypothetical protein FE782_09000 [Paenibacillus antri]